MSYPPQQGDKNKRRKPPMSSNFPAHRYNQPVSQVPPMMMGHGHAQPYQSVPAPKPSSMMGQSQLHQMMMPQPMMTQPTRINDQTMQMNLQGGVLNAARQTQPLQPAPTHRQPAPTMMPQPPTGQQVGTQMRPPMTATYQNSMEKSHHPVQQQPLSHGYDSTGTVNRQQSNTSSFAGIVGQPNTHQTHQNHQGHDQGLPQRVGQQTHHIQQQGLHNGHQAALQQGMHQLNPHKAQLPIQQGHQSLTQGMTNMTLQQGHQGITAHQGGIQQGHQVLPQSHQDIHQDNVQQPQGIVGQTIYHQPQHTQHSQSQPQRPPQTFMAQPQMVPATVQHVPQPQPIRPPSRQQRAYRTLRQTKDAEGKRLWTFASVVQVLSGDSIEVKSWEERGTTWENKILTCDGILAPRTARGRSGDEDAFGWESKEFLRDVLMKPRGAKFIGYCEVDRGGPSLTMMSQGQKLKRVFCHMEILDEEMSNPSQNIDIAELMVSNGWCSVKQKRGADYNESEQLTEEEQRYHKLKDLEDQAKIAKVGKHSCSFALDVALDEHTREVDWINNRREDAERAKAFFEMVKHREIDAIVDQVREATVIRFEVIPDDKFPEGDKKHRMVLVNLWGVKGPSIPLSYQQAYENWKNRVAKGISPGYEPKIDDHQPEKFAQVAKEHTEKRLLGYRVKLTLEFGDNRGNLYGTACLVAGDKRLDITPSLVKVGYAAVVPWQAKRMEKGDQLLAAQKHAMSQRLNIWSVKPEDRFKPVVGFKSLRGIVDLADVDNGKDSSPLTGFVTNVRNGDCITVQLNSGETKDYYLASLRAYRYGFGPQDSAPPRPRGSEDALKRLSMAREVLRVHTIAKDRPVTVEEEYEQERKVTRNMKGKTVTEMQKRVYASIFVTDKKGVKLNLGLELCKMGLAEALSYDPKQNERAKYWGELQDETKNAKDNKVGYHGNFKEDTYLDLTVRKTDKRFVSQQLNEMWNMGLAAKKFEADVEYVFTGHKVKVIVDIRKLFGNQVKKLGNGRARGAMFDTPRRAISIILEGIRCNGIVGRNDPTDNISESQRLGNEARDYVSRAINQRTISVQIATFRNDCFFGWIEYGNKQSLNEELVAKGYAKCFEQFFERNERMRALQTNAMNNLLKIWHNYKPQANEVEAENTQEERQMDRTFEGTCTHVDSGHELYVVRDGLEEQKIIEAELAKLKERPPFQGGIIRYQMMAGLFGKLWYRCKILRQRGRKNQGDQPPSWDVIFVDYGNTFALGKHQLQPLPRELVNYPPMAKKCKLAFLDPSKDSQLRDMSGHMLSKTVMEKKLSIRVLGYLRANPVDVEVTMGSISVNEDMVEKGYLWLKKTQVKRIKKSEDKDQLDYVVRIQAKERTAKYRRLGLWVYGDPDSDSEEN